MLAALCSLYVTAPGYFGFVCIYLGGEKGENAHIFALLFTVIFPKSCSSSGGRLNVPPSLKELQRGQLRRGQFFTTCLGEDYVARSVISSDSHLL